jgi:hypothetical protein
MVRFGDVQVVFEPTDDALGVAKGGGTKVIESFQPPAGPPAPPPPAPRAPPAPLAPPAAATAPPAPKVQPPAKPVTAAPKPPVSAPPRRPAPAPARGQQKKSKGCGASAAVFLLATSAIVYWILV